MKLDAHEQNAVTVRVTNTGSVGGKEVVQLYMDAPYQSDTEHFGIQERGLEKSKVTLIAFAKTKNLEPGQSQNITLKFDTDELASLDDLLFPVDGINQIHNIVEGILGQRWNVMECKIGFPAPCGGFDDIQPSLLEFRTIYQFG